MMTRRSPKVESDPLPHRPANDDTERQLAAAVAVEANAAQYIAGLETANARLAERVAELERQVETLEAAALPSYADVVDDRARYPLWVRTALDEPGTPLHDAVLAETGVTV